MRFIEDHNEIAKKLDIGKELIYLTKADVLKAALTEQDILSLTRQALLAHGSGDFEMPAKIGLHPYEDVFYHAMPAYVPSKKAVGMKWIECYPGNPKRFGLPQTTGLLILNDIPSGCPIAIMDATWITSVRTPATTVLAAGELHSNAETFGMFGCGIQGIGHVKYIVNTLKNLKKIYIHDINEAAMDNLIELVQGEIDVEIVKGRSAEELAKGCEVLSSATIITRDTLSIVKDEWISKGQTILPCDLNTFWDPKIAKRADKYIVDSIEEHELFDDMGYFPDGLPKIYGETGEILAGIKKGRENKDEIIVCSNIGTAVCDMVVAREIFDIALKNDIGNKMPL